MVAAMPLLEVVQLGVKIGELLGQLELLGLAFRLLERGLGHLQPPFERVSPRHRREHRLHQSALGQAGDVLREVARPGSPAEANRPPIRGHSPGEDLHQR